MIDFFFFTHPLNSFFVLGSKPGSMRSLELAFPSSNKKGKTINSSASYCPQETPHQQLELKTKMKLDNPSSFTVKVDRGMISLTLDPHSMMKKEKEDEVVPYPGVNTPDSIITQDPEETAFFGTYKRTRIGTSSSPGPATKKKRKFDHHEVFKGEERKFSMRLRLKSTDVDEKEKTEFEFFTV